jgi:hypothetical protein
MILHVSDEEKRIFNVTLMLIALGPLPPFVTRPRPRIEVTREIQKAYA